MKSFTEILDSFKEDTALEFGEELSKVQSFFHYANENIKPFQKIQYRGGNETCLTEIVTKLQALLHELELIDAETNEPVAEKSEKLRKITFYLMLNTEIQIKWKLSDDFTVCHLENTVPQLTKCLLLACVWGLKLEKYFCECIAYSPIWFASPFTDGIVENIKDYKPYEILATSEQIVRSIYINIARSDYRSMDIAEKHNHLNKFNDAILDILREFYTTDDEKYEKWSKNRRYKYIGFVLKHTLDLILFCFGVFQKRPDFHLDPNTFGVYQLMKEKEQLNDSSIEGYSEAAGDLLKKLNITLLNTLQQNVMQVDCHAFMYWVEIDLNDESTLQSSVGEAAHALIELLNINACFKHEVGQQLKTIAVKPITVAERVSQFTIGELITKLESFSRSDNDLGLWIDSFIGRGELVLDNQECLETLATFTDILTSGNIRQLILYACNVKEDSAVDDKLIDICLNSIDYLFESDILPLVRLAADEQKSHFTVFQLDNYEKLLTEVFNRCQYTEDSKSFLKLLFQNPQLFYDKVFDEAIRSEQQMTHMLEILKATSKVASTYVEENLDVLINDKIRTDDETIQRLIPRFIAKAFFLNILEPHTFITQLLYQKYLIPAMLSHNYPKISMLIKAFWGISLKYRFGDLSPPILVMAAQVLQQCRWDLIKYTNELETIIVKTTEFINEVMKKYLPTAGEQDKGWILSRINTYRPLTRYYFQRLSLAPDETPLTFDKFLHPNGFRNATQTDKIQFLCETLVRCTEKEISWLAKNSELMDSFWEAFELICTIVGRSSTAQANAINCFRHCCTAFFHVIKYSVLPSTAKSDDKIDLLKNIVNLFQCLQSVSIYNELLLNVHPLMLTIVEETLSEQKEALTDEVKPLIGSLADCEAKSMLNAKFEVFLL